MEKIFITGISGFIGSSIGTELISRGYLVYGLIRKKPDNSFRLINSKITLLIGDLSSRDFISDFLKENNITIVIHAAALVSDWGTKEMFYKTNVEGTENLLEACNKSNIKTFINISTIDVMFYTHKKHNILHESTLHTKSEHYYQLTKKIAEQKVLEFSEYFKVIALRPSWVFGPYDKTLFPEIIKYLQKGMVPIPGSGEALVPLIFIENLTNFIADIIMQKDFLENPIKINLADDIKITWNGLINILKEKLNLNAKIIHIPHLLYYIVALITQSYYQFFRIKNRPPLTIMSLPMLVSSIEVNTKEMKKYSKTKPVSFEDSIEKTVKWFLLK